MQQGAPKKAVTHYTNYSEKKNNPQIVESLISAYLSLGDFYERKRDIFTAAISNSRFKILPSAGTYFQLLSYDSISEEKDTDFAVCLIKEYKIASIPVSVFYNIANDQKVLRFCFAKSEETLAQAAEIINKI